MENKRILLYILILYGLLIVFFWMFYTQQYVNGQAKIRSEFGNGNKTNQLLNKIYHPGSADDDDYMYTSNTSNKIQTMTEKEKDTDSKVVVERIAVRKYYVSLDNMKETLNYDCEQCALVSSSGQLLGRGLGKEIDANDCVIRMNNAPSGIYHEDVGNRTTVRMGSFNAAGPYSKQKQLFEGEASPDVVVMWGLFQKQHAKILTTAKKLPKLYPKTKFYAETLSGEDYAGTIFERETGMSRKNSKTWLSTGWFTMLMVIDICKQVNLYGFIPEDHCQTHPGEVKRYHYYQSPNSSLVECKYYTANEGRTRGSGHRFVTEKAIFSRWAHQYSMKFQGPSWNITSESGNVKIDTPFMKNQSKIKRRPMVRKKKYTKRH